MYRAADAGEIDLTARLTVGATDAMRGSGMLRYAQDEITLTLPRLGRSLTELGCLTTRLIYPPEPNAGPRGEGLTTARELTRLTTMLARDECASPASCQAIREHLECQQHGDQIARLLPHNLYAKDRGVPLRLSVANKTGFTTGVRADAALITLDGAARIAIATLAADHIDHGTYPDHPRNLVNAIAARFAVEELLPKHERLTATPLARWPRIPMPNTLRVD